MKFATHFGFGLYVYSFEKEIKNTLCFARRDLPYIQPGNEPGERKRDSHALRSQWPGRPRACVTPSVEAELVYVRSGWPSRVTSRHPTSVG